MIKQIGPYEVIREIGRGGMGVVYLANDSQLDRQVAIKALPTELAADPARLDRFEREAKTLASLNHSNLAGIYGVEKQDGARYLILEYVDGETLEHTLDRGPMPVDDALELTVQIAAGVEAAHDAGVIHRDLKPANIVITPEGVAKVLDFGLARIDDGNSSAGTFDQETLSLQRQQHSPTIEGAILGTAAYMSPEQARGRRVDKRTDIWSFGVVLYEMLVGQSPFRGETASDSIGAVLHKSFDLSSLPKDVPFGVKRVLERCLERDRNQRYRDIGDVRIELERAGDQTHFQALEPGKSAMVWKIAAGVLLLVAISAWGWVATRPEIKDALPSPTLELVIPIPVGSEIKGSIAISRDGERVAFCAEDESGERRLYIRELDQFDLIEVPQSRDAEDPTFSYDGRSVLFFKQDGLFRAPVDGGRPSLLTKTTSSAGISASDDGSVVYSTGVDSPLWSIPPGEATPVALTDLGEIPGTYAHVWPQHIPGTNKILLTSWGDKNIGGARITDTQTGSVSPVTEDFFEDFVPPARWVASGHLIAEAWGTLIAVPFDPELGGDFDDYERKQVLTSVYHLGNATRCVFDVSDNGTLAYVPGDPNKRRLVWVEADGSVKDVIDTDLASGFRLGGNISISPDGTQALVGGGGDIAVIDLERGVPRRITFDQGNNLNPQWSSDGTRVFFNSNRQDNWAIWSVAADGLSPPELVYKDENSTYIRSIGPNNLISFDLQTPDSGDDLWIIESDGNSRPLVETRYDEGEGAISSDGKWIAYTSNISGRNEIYIIPISGSGQPVQVSVGGGNAPKWGPLGTALYYRNGRSMFRHEMTVGRPVGRPMRVFEGPTLLDGSTYALSSDESRVLTVELDDEAIPDEIRIITNFFDTIRSVAGRGSRQE